MTQPSRNEEREDRIRSEVLVDAYTPEERAYGWYIYLADHMAVPFRGRCIAERAVSPLVMGEEVCVVGMSSVEACQHEPFVTIAWQDRELGVPLSQVEPVDVDHETETAIADWHYWDERGHR